MGPELNCGGGPPRLAPIPALRRRTPDTLLAQRFPGSEPRSIPKQRGSGWAPRTEADVSESELGLETWSKCAFPREGSGPAPHTAVLITSTHGGTGSAEPVGNPQDHPPHLPASWSGPHTGGLPGEGLDTGGEGGV